MAGIQATVERFASGNGWIDMRWGACACICEVDVRHWGLGFIVRWYSPKITGGRLPVVFGIQVGPFSVELYLGRG